MQPIKKVRLFSAGKQSITLLAVGDICFHGFKKTNISNEWFTNLFSKELLDILYSKDVSLGNLECPLTTKHNPILKSGLYLSASPETIEALKILKLDLAVLANNHILDYGTRAMYETISTCEKAGIKTLGVGANLEEACRPLFIDLKGKKLAFLAFAEEEFSCATDTTGGAAKLDLAIAGSVIRKAKQKADVVIVNVHGGNEFYPIPSPRMQRWYRFLVECGANAIICHHPHAIQGIEIYQNVPIIYSLGNFLFKGAPNMPKCYYQSLIVKLIISDNKVCTVEVFPCEQINRSKEYIINGISVDILRNQYRESFERKFKRLCQIASDPTLIHEFWKCFCHYYKKYYCNSLKMSSASIHTNIIDLTKRIIKGRKSSYLIHFFGDLINLLLQKESTKYQSNINLKNLMTCPAHHETIVSILEMEILKIKPQSKIQDEFNQLIIDCIYPH